MALTQADLQQIRQVMDESITEHPRFDAVRDEIKTDIIGEVSELINHALELIDKRFNLIEDRLDNLRIVTR